MAQLLETLDKLLWGWPLIIALLGTHIFMTVRTGFVQKELFRAIRLSVTKEEGADGDVSQFGALTAALSSTIGTGNIIGVGTAITMGGPGAVFWMWITGLLGMATKYAETLIACRYRVRSEDGSMIGGAMYALERGLHMKWLGIVFALLALVCAFGIGNMVQANAVSVNIQENFCISPWIIAAVLAVMTGIVIFGGIQSIARLTETLVPFMAGLYILGCLVILCMNHDTVLQALTVIFKGAFQPQSIAGGTGGYLLSVTLRYGFARGLFSNESGMGSAPLVASAAKTKNPKRQALVSMTGTFWDTVVICLLTGTVLVSCMLKGAGGMNSANGAALSSSAFGMIPVIGKPVLIFGLITFAFSTILGWYYYGERCAVYLFGERVIPLYKGLWITAVGIGAMVQIDVVWNLADLLNGLMAIPNMVAVILLSREIAELTERYSGRHIEDLDMSEMPVVHNSDRGVLHRLKSNRQN